MGHVIGMLDERGHDAWWAESELINVSLELQTMTKSDNLSDRESEQEETYWSNSASPFRVLFISSSRTNPCSPGTF
jgi:hypothetical protein